MLSETKWKYGMCKLKNTKGYHQKPWKPKRNQEVHPLEEPCEGVWLSQFLANKTSPPFSDRKMFEFSLLCGLRLAYHLRKLDVLKSLSKSVV